MWFNNKIREKLFYLGWREFSDGRFNRLFYSFGEKMGGKVCIEVCKDKPDANYVGIEFIGTEKGNDKLWGFDGHHHICSESGYQKTMQEAVSKEKEHIEKHHDNHNIDDWEWGMANKALDELSALDWSVEE